MQLTINLIINDCDVSAEAEFDVTREPADRSVGSPAGWTAKLLTAQLGGLELRRSQVSDMIGKTALASLEDWAGDEAVRLAMRGAA